MLKRESALWSLVTLAILLAAGCGDSEEQSATAHIAASDRSTTRTTSTAVTPNPMGSPQIPTTAFYLTATPPNTAAPVQPRRSDFVVTAVPPTGVPTVSSLSLLTPTSVRADIGVSKATCNYKATFLSDVSIPDDAVVEPGATMIKTWRFQNSGTCAWDAGVKLAFSGGDPMSGPDAVTITATPPLSTTDVSVSLVAPVGAGTYSGHWQLQAPDGQPMGGQVFVRIVVPSPPTSAVDDETPSEANTARVLPLVLLNYFAWYDADGWDDCNISAGDRPLELYNSDDPATIGRHIRMALDANVDGFTQQWFAPGDRTDRNFSALLDQSVGTGFRSTIVFLRHIWRGSPAASQASVTEAIRYVVAHYGNHPNFLTQNGKPVLFFTDLYRVPAAAGQSAPQAWAAIRRQADPNGMALWIGEGLDPSYLAVFDGLWVYKITHAVSPQAYLRARQWADAVRAWEIKTGQQKLWIATLSPGWDDTRAGCRADVRIPSAAHQQARGDGAFFGATFDAAMSSDPDWLWVNSFNEWVEGTYIEPSLLYGDRYLQLTRQFTAAFKSR